VGGHREHVEEVLTFQVQTVGLRDVYEVVVDLVFDFASVVGHIVLHLTLVHPHFIWHEHCHVAINGHSLLFCRVQGLPCHERVAL